MNKIRKIRVPLLIIILLIISSCAGKEPANVSPEVHSKFVARQYIKALSDFQDVVEVAYKNGNISRENTRYVAQALRIAFNIIHEIPNGAKRAAIVALDTIAIQIGSTGELSKFLPYISAARLVIEEIKE